MKKVTRFMVLNRQREMLGWKRFLRGLHLSLTGPEAGEVSTLTGLGAPMRSLVGVEWHHATAVTAHKRYPQLTIFEKDIRDAAYLLRGKLESAFLDFCGHADPDHLEVTRLLAKECLKGGGVLALGCHVGREKRMDHYRLTGPCSNLPGADKLQPSIARAAYITQQINLQNSGLSVREWYFYRSRVDGWKGQPMIVVQCQKTTRKFPLRIYHFDMSDEQFQDYVNSFRGTGWALFNM